MKEELLKILEGINLEYDKESENASGYENIKKDFEYAIKIVKNAESIDEDIFKEVKELASEIEEGMSDFKKFKRLNKMQNKICVFVK